MNVERINANLHWFLSFGFGIFLTSPFWAESKSNITTGYYLGFLLPTVLIAILKFRELSDLFESTSFRIYLLFGLWATLSIFWSSSDESVISLVKRPLYIAALFVGVFFLIRWSETRFHSILRISALVATLWMGWWLYRFIILGGTPAERFMGYGPSINPIHFSQVLGFFFLYWLVSWWHSPQKFSLLDLTGVLVMFLALTYANSRSPFLGILLAIFLISAIKRDRRAVWVSLGMAAAAILFYTNTSIRILEPNTSYRFDVWKEVLVKFAESPLYGHGYDAGIEFFVPKIKSFFTDTHGIHFGVLFELGVIGLIIWIVFYASLARDFFRSEKTPLIMFSGCLAIFGFGSGITDGMTYLSRPKEHWFILWLPFSMLLASVLVSKESRANLSSPASK